MKAIDRNSKITFIGGDLRSIVAAERLSEIGYNTQLFGFGEVKNGKSFTAGAVDSLCCSSCETVLSELSPYVSRINEEGGTTSSIDEALENCSIVVLPLPASQDGERISMPFSNLELKLDRLVELMSEHNIKLLCGGKLSDSLCKACHNAGIDTFDYYSREEFAIANAIPTAEGAIAIAMNELAITIDNCKSLVIGYGRIGKVLSKKLTFLGSKVTVSARKPEDFAWIREAGLQAVKTGALAELFEDKYLPDVIFNTVPYCILGRKELEKIKLGTLIIDLASRPGGVDIAAAGELGHKVIWALSLPGKVAPVTAGIIIADTIDGYISELREE
jgi:dipicolinate synthase subunit A